MAAHIPDFLRICISTKFLGAAAAGLGNPLSGRCPRHAASRHPELAPEPACVLPHPGLSVCPVGLGLGSSDLPGHLAGPLPEMTPVLATPPLGSSSGTRV